MIPKPKHLGLEYAAQFKDRGIVDAYPHRPSYPPETFEILSHLIPDEPRTVLDVGCGIGDIARRLVEFVARVCQSCFRAISSVLLKKCNSLLQHRVRVFHHVPFAPLDQNIRLNAHPHKLCSVREAIPLGAYSHTGPVYLDPQWLAGGTSSGFTD